MMEEIRINRVAITFALVKEDIKKLFRQKTHDLIEEVSANEKV